MTDRIYPSAKPPTATVPSVAPKPNPYNRHPYRPNPTPRRRRSHRSYLCLCCFWSILTLILLLLLTAIAACAAYLIYSPHRPSFTVTALRISRFNLTTATSDETTRLSTTVNLTVTAKNPNKRITYLYDPISVLLYSEKVIIANGTLPSFDNYQNTPNVFRPTLSSSSALIDADLVSGLRSVLKRKKGVPMKIKLNTNVRVKIEKFKTMKIGLRVICEGIKGILPKGKLVSVSPTSNEKCKVDFRIKIWKFTF